jgi:hypothetical protein
MVRKWSAVDAGNRLDVALVTPEQLALFGDRRFDIAINMCSVGEMSYETIQESFQVFRRHMAPGILYCANRISKRNPHDVITVDVARYPWAPRPRDKFLCDENMAGVPICAVDHREAMVRLMLAE